MSFPICLTRALKPELLARFLPMLFTETILARRKTHSSSLQQGKLFEANVRRSPRKQNSSQLPLPNY